MAGENAARRQMLEHSPFSGERKSRTEKGRERVQTALPRFLACGKGYSAARPLKKRESFFSPTLLLYRKRIRVQPRQSREGGKKEVICYWRKKRGKPLRRGKKNKRGSFKLKKQRTLRNGQRMERRKFLS